MGGAPLSFVQHFLGHASSSAALRTGLATTGIYTRSTDPLTKEIALRIPTALDRAEPRRKARQAKEARAEYGAAIEDWSVFVAYVLDWRGDVRD